MQLLSEAAKQNQYHIVNDHIVYSGVNITHLAQGYGIFQRSVLKGNPGEENGVKIPISHRIIYANLSHLLSAGVIKYFKKEDQKTYDELLKAQVNKRSTVIKYTHGAFVIEEEKIKSILQAVEKKEDISPNDAVLLAVNMEIKNISLIMSSAKYLERQRNRTHAERIGDRGKDSPPKSLKLTDEKTTLALV